MLFPYLVLYAVYGTAFITFLNFFGKATPSRFLFLNFYNNLFMESLSIILSPGIYKYNTRARHLVWVASKIVGGGGCVVTVE